MDSVFYHLVSSQTDTALKEDEYLHPSGMIYCMRCHSPRQRVLNILGQEFRPRMLCRCQTEERDREEQAEELRRLRLQIDRNRAVGLPDPTLRKHTFANDKGYNREAMAAAKNYVLHFDSFRQQSMGLLLWGGVGSGKSFIAGCIANGLLDQGVKVLMTNCSRLLNRLMDLQSGERNGFLNSLNDYGLLIIDDLGTERNSEFAKEQIFSVIDSRYRSGLPMIVTTNLHIRELEAPEELARMRIFDRVRERCIPLCVDERNIRTELRRQSEGRLLPLLENPRKGRNLSGNFGTNC